MIPAREPRRPRVLRHDAATGRTEVGTLRELPRWLKPGDLLVVNDAATFPASVPGRLHGEIVELRLATVAVRPGDPWRAVLLGAGDWRLPTEERGATPAVSMGEVIEAAGLAATVTAVEHPRLVELRFDAPHALVLAQLLRTGRPIQYSYLRAQLDPWDVHSGFGARPWAVEAPSAGRDLPWAVLRQVDVATVTEAAGISSTGDPALDARLPLPERYAIPAATVAAVGRARRVIAAGTSVVRALEGCVAEHGALVATEGVTDLRLGPGTALSVVDGLLTGMHEVGTSHDALARAVAGADAVGAVLAEAEARGMLGHEFGDLALFC